MEGLTHKLVEKALEKDVDPLLAVAITFQESRHCKSYAAWFNNRYHNCAGVMNGGQSDGLKKYVNWDSFLEDYISLLALRIPTLNPKTIRELGKSYAPVVSHPLNNHWASAVSSRYIELWNKL